MRTESLRYGEADLRQSWTPGGTEQVVIHDDDGINFCSHCCVRNVA